MRDAIDSEGIYPERIANELWAYDIWISGIQGWL